MKAAAIVVAMLLADAEALALGGPRVVGLSAPRRAPLTIVAAEASKEEEEKEDRLGAGGRRVGQLRHMLALQQTQLQTLSKKRNHPQPQRLRRNVAGFPAQICADRRAVRRPAAT